MLCMGKWDIRREVPKQTRTEKIQIFIDIDVIHGSIC